MPDDTAGLVAVHLPADLIARLEELKQDREEDRKQSVEQIIEGFCRRYVKVCEAHRWERAHQDELERAYQEQPSDADDEEWPDLAPGDEGEQP